MQFYLDFRVVCSKLYYVYRRFKCLVQSSYLAVQIAIQIYSRALSFILAPRKVSLLKSSEDNSQ